MTARKQALLETLYMLAMAIVLAFLLSSCQSVNKPKTSAETEKQETAEWLIASDSVAFDNVKRLERTVFIIKKESMIHQDQLGEYYFDILQRDVDGTVHVLCHCNGKEYKMLLNLVPGRWGISMIHPERTINFHILTATKRPW